MFIALSTCLQRHRFIAVQRCRMKKLIGQAISPSVRVSTSAWRLVMLAVICKLGFATAMGVQISRASKAKLSWG